MSIVNIRLDDRDLLRGIAAHKARFPYAIRRALKRTATSTTALMAKSIAQDTGLPSRFVKKEIKIDTLGDVGVRIRVEGDRIPLIAFKARGPEPSRGKGRGVSYRLPGGRGRDPNAFIATMKSGHRGVYKRTTKARLPIVQLHGPSLMGVFVRYMQQGAEHAKEALIKNLRAEISYALSKK